MSVASVVHLFMLSSRGRVSRSHESGAGLHKRSQSSPLQRVAFTNFDACVDQTEASPSRIVVREDLVPRNVLHSGRSPEHCAIVDVGGQEYQAWKLASRAGKMHAMHAMFGSCPAIEQ